MVHAHLAEAQHPAQLMVCEVLRKTCLDWIVHFLLDYRVLLSTAGRGCLSTSMGDAELGGGFLEVLAAPLETDRGA